MTTLLEKCQAPCPSHAPDFARLQEAITGELDDTGGLAGYHRRQLRIALQSLHRDCEDCQRATLEAARAYAQAHPAPAQTLAPTKLVRYSTRAPCNRTGHSHNVLGGCVYPIPTSLFPGVGGKGMELHLYMRAYKGSEWARWLDDHWLRRETPSQEVTP